MNFLESISCAAPGAGTRHGIDWWVSGPASRHHELSSLFARLVRAVMISDDLAAADAPDTVVVDSPALKRLVGRLARERGVRVNVLRELPWFRRAVRRCRAFLSPGRSATRILFDWLIVRCLATAPRLDGDRGVVLVDTFVLPASVDTDRYYPSLFDFLDEQERRTVRLVPQFHGFSPGAMIRAVRRLRGRSSRYLFKEGVLRFGDVAWAVGYILRVRRIRIAGAEFAGMDVSELVKEDLRDAMSYRCAIQGLLNYRFAARLRASGVDVRLAVDWFENHPLDRGWNAGFRQHFPHVALTGYQGFYPAFPAARPAAFERAAGVIPDQVVTIGESMVEDLREFDPGLPVAIGPAFRYRHIETLDPVDPAFARCVLAVLPYDRAAREPILEQLAAAESALSSYELTLKPHPATDVAALARWRDARLPGARICTASLATALSSSAVVIGGPVATSSLEVIAMGRPYISIRLPGMAGEHSPPRRLDADALACVSDSRELAASIKAFAGSTHGAGQRRRVCERVRRRYFNGVERAGIERLLALPGTQQRSTPDRPAS